MEAITTSLVRPAARRGITSTRTSLKQQIRTRATAARTKRALNIPPHPSFLTPTYSSSSAAAAAHQQHHQDTIIFNPPSAAPSVYHTPFKFLPKTDPRRRANLASLFESHFGGAPPSSSTSSSSSSSAATIGSLPVVQRRAPSGSPALTDRPPVTREEVEEMRLLRASDPHKWSVRALGAKYNIPTTFVRAACQAPPEKIEFERRKMELIQQRWGPAKRKAREERARRTAMLLRGEL